MADGGLDGRLFGPSVRSVAGFLPNCVFNSRLEYKYSYLTVILIVDL